MNDTLKIWLTPKLLNHNWNIEDIKKRLQPFEKFHRNGYKPLGYLGGSMSVKGNDRFLLIEGSLAKYWQRDNVRNFEWKWVKPALKQMAKELGLPIQRGNLIRIDIAYNIPMEHEVEEYFNQLNYLFKFQRIDRNKTTLRYESNNMNTNFLIYDKLAHHRKKKIPDGDLLSLCDSKNLLRIELQVQKRAKAPLKMNCKNSIKVVQLYAPTFYKKLLDLWFDIYTKIEKESDFVLFRNSKGRKAFHSFILQDWIHLRGLKVVNTILTNSVTNKSLTYDDKSKLLSKFKEAMKNQDNYKFQDRIVELNFKMKKVYDEQEIIIRKLGLGIVN